MLAGQTCLLWLSIVLSETEGINYTVLGLRQTKTIKISRWFYNAATISPLVLRELRYSGFDRGAVLRRPRAQHALLSPCCRIPLSRALPAFPAATSATICALETGQRRSCSSHPWFMDQTAGVNYRGSPRHNRRLANINALSLCHWGWMSCSIQDYFFSLQTLIQTINMGDCLSSTTTITKAKETSEHPYNTWRKVKGSTVFNWETCWKSGLPRSVAAECIQFQIIERAGWHFIWVMKIICSEFLFE